MKLDKKKKIDLVIAKHYPFASLNPYQDLMLQGLAAHLVNAAGIEGGLRVLVIEASSRNADVLHLHWIHGAATFHNLPGALLRFGLFHSALLLARYKGKRIVWTVHNLLHHEHHRDWLDRLNSRLVARHAHAILVHGYSVVSLVASQLGVDLSPKISAKSSMRFPLRCNEEISYEEAIHRRTDHQSHQASRVWGQSRRDMP